MSLVSVSQLFEGGGGESAQSSEVDGGGGGAREGSVMLPVVVVGDGGRDDNGASSEVNGGAPVPPQGQTSSGGGLIEINLEEEKAVVDMDQSIQEEDEVNQGEGMMEVVDNGSNGALIEVNGVGVGEESTHHHHWKSVPNLSTEGLPFNHCKIILSLRGNDGEDEVKIVPATEKDREGWNVQDGQLTYRDGVTLQEKEKLGQSQDIILNSTEHPVAVSDLECYSSEDSSNGSSLFEIVHVKKKAAVKGKPQQTQTGGGALEMEEGEETIKDDNKQFGRNLNLNTIKGPPPSVVILEETDPLANTSPDKASSTASSAPVGGDPSPPNPNGNRTPTGIGGAASKLRRNLKLKHLPSNLSKLYKREPDRFQMLSYWLTKVLHGGGQSSISKAKARRRRTVALKSKPSSVSALARVDDNQPGGDPSQANGLPSSGKEQPTIVGNEETTTTGSGTGNNNGNGEISFHCPFCLLPFLEAEALIQHLANHKEQVQDRILNVSLSDMSVPDPDANININDDDWKPPPEDGNGDEEEDTERMEVLPDENENEDDEEEDTERMELLPNNNVIYEVPMSGASAGAPLDPLHISTPTEDENEIQIPFTDEAGSDHDHDQSSFQLESHEEEESRVKVATHAESNNEADEGRDANQCQHCSFLSSDLAKHKKHARCHDASRPWKYRCIPCSAYFVALSGFKGHLKFLHKNENDSVSPPEEAPGPSQPQPPVEPNHPFQSIPLENPVSEPEKENEEMKLLPLGTCQISLSRCDYLVQPNNGTGDVVDIDTTDDSTDSITSSSEDDDEEESDDDDDDDEDDDDAESDKKEDGVGASRKMLAELVEAHIIDDKEEDSDLEDEDQVEDVASDNEENTQEEEEVPVPIVEESSQSSSVAASSTVPRISERARQSLKCDECGRRYKSLAILETHMRIHSDEKPFQCKRCSCAYRQLANLQFHEKFHDPSLPFKCPGPDCTLYFDKESSLKIHKGRVHGGTVAAKIQNKQPCMGRRRRTTLEKIKPPRSTPLTKTRRAPFKKPLKLSGSSKKPKPSSSRETIQTPSKTVVNPPKSTKVANLELEASSDKKTYQCEQCQMDFKHQQYLTFHMGQHDSTRPYQCSRCDLYFVTSRGVEVHESKAHKVLKEPIPGKTLAKRMQTKSKSSVTRKLSRVAPLKIMKSMSTASLLSSQSRRSLTRGTTASMSSSKTEVVTVDRRIDVDEEEATTEGVEMETDEVEVSDTEDCVDNVEYILPDFSSQMEINVVEPNGEVSTSRIDVGGSSSALGTPQSNGKSLTCRHCSRSFSNSDRFQIHMKICKEINPVECDKCSMRFRHTINLRLHAKFHDPNNPWVCSCCSLRFDKEQGLKIHETRMHKGMQARKLAKAPATSSSTEASTSSSGAVPSSLNPLEAASDVDETKSEVAGQPDKKPFRCDHPNCHFSFSQLTQLQFHMSLHDSTRKWKCNRCGLYFLTSGGLRIHETRNHTGLHWHTAGSRLVASSSKAKKIPALKSICGTLKGVAVAVLPVSNPKQLGKVPPRTSHRFLPTPKKSLTPIQRTERTLAAVPASPSSSGDSNEENDIAKSDMGGGAEVSTGTRVEPLKELPVANSKDGARNRQVAGTASTTKPPPTPPTNSASSFSGLMVKLRNGTYRCKSCNRTVASAYSAKRHLLVHTDERPYPCPTCSKCFRFSDSLKRHIRCHTGEKPHQCPECSKKFATSYQLNRHIRTHKSA